MTARLEEWRSRSSSRSFVGVLARMLFCLGQKRAPVLVIFFSQLGTQWVVWFRLADQTLQRLDYCNDIRNTQLLFFHMLFSSPPHTIFLQSSFQAILVPTTPLAPQIQRVFPVDIVRNTNLLTYLLTDTPHTLLRQHRIARGSGSVVAIVTYVTLISQRGKCRP